MALSDINVKGTLSAVLTEAGNPSFNKLLSVESQESPSSFLMSSSSLSRFTPLTTLMDLISKPAKESSAPAALDLDLTPTSGPFGDPEAAAVLALSTALAAALFLRKRFPFRLWSLLDWAETGTLVVSGGGELRCLASSWTCLRLRMLPSIWASLLRAAVWEDDTHLTRQGAIEESREKKKF